MATGEKNENRKFVLSSAHP